MTLAQFKALSPEERAGVLEVIETNEWLVPDSFDENILDIEFFFEKRKKARKPGIDWPENLSKKEQVLCKVDMIQTMLNTALTKWDLAVTGEEFIKSILKEIYSTKVELGVKFLGLDEDAACVLNAFYKSLNKAFRKKMQI